MDLTFLGTASCIPSITRGVSCIALRFNSDSWLFDCGESSQIQVQRSKVKPSKIKKIFITHNHGDHSFGIPGMLCLMGQATQLERSAGVEERPAPVEIYGPEGTRDMVRAMIQLTYSRITVPHVIHELRNVPYLHGRFAKQPPPPMVRTRFDPFYGEAPGSRDIYPDEDGFYRLFEDEEVYVAAAAMQHTVPCVGYMVKEKNKAGRLRLDAVKDIVDRNFEALGSVFRNPMKVYAALKSLGPKETYVFPDGTSVSAEQILDPPRRGRKVVIMGDTCSGEQILPMCMDADVVVHEATNSWIREVDGTRHADYNALERDTAEHGHSTPQMAGRFAKIVRAKKLLLTHFSPRYRGDESEASMKIMWRVEEQARETACLTGDCDVVAAWDLMVYPVPDPEE
jgi:ribonuclease Z